MSFSLGMKNTVPLKVLLIVLLSELVVLPFVAGVFWFKGQSSGIALGYEEASARAYQMGRPLPDTIFEKGFFRVAVSNISASSTEPFRVRIAVRDRITNATLYSSERRVEMLK